jgi:hypothetical protein
MAAIKFHRAYAGTIAGMIMTLNHSPAIASRKARLIHFALGLGYLTFGIIHFVCAFTRHS